MTVCSFRQVVKINKIVSRNKLGSDFRLMGEKIRNCFVGAFEKKQSMKQLEKRARSGAFPRAFLRALRVNFERVFTFPSASLHVRFLSLSLF